MGLSDQDLEEYAAQGVYIPSLRHVPGFKFDEQSSFYQRKKESNVGVRSDKDELWSCFFVSMCLGVFVVCYICVEVTVYQSSFCVNCVSEFL